MIISAEEIVSFKDLFSGIKNLSTYLETTHIFFVAKHKMNKFKISKKNIDVK